MRDVKKWAEAQLKKGYTKRQLKGLLVGRGYPPTAVAEVDKVTSQGKDKKKISIAVFVLIVIVVLAIVFINIYPNLYINSLCKEFKDSGYGVSCNEAVTLALADRQGTIQNIAIGTKRIPTESEGRILIKDTRLWLIDIKLDEPSYDENLNKEIQLLRVGIGTDEHFGIHREVIE